MSSENQITLEPIGFIESPLKNREGAPRQGHEGAPDAWVNVNPKFVEAMHGLAVGDLIILLTWFHQSDRATLQVHPRNERKNPITGVFATRSPDRPNPIGLHEVHVYEIVGNRMKVGPLEAIDGTPVVDIKPVI